MKMENKMRRFYMKKTLILLLILGLVLANFVAVVGASLYMPEEIKICIANTYCGGTVHLEGVKDFNEDCALNKLRTPLPLGYTHDTICVAAVLDWAYANIGWSPSAPPPDTVPTAIKDYIANMYCNGTITLAGVDSFVDACMLDSLKTPLPAGETHDSICIGEVFDWCAANIGYTPSAKTEMMPDTSLNVEIFAFDQNPAGYDEGNEWVALYNPMNSTANLSNWKLKTKYGGDGGKTVTISEDAKLIPEEEGTNIAPHGYRFVTCSTGFLRNENECITLLDPSGNEIDRTCNCIDKENNNRFCMRDQNGSDTDSCTDWTFQTQNLEKCKIGKGKVIYVEDGDTLDISPLERAYIQRIRLAGIDTPERDNPGYEEAKEFVKEMCSGEEVEFDIDDCKQYDEYHRILAVLYVNGVNLNAELLKKGYAEVMYIPPSEFDSREWEG